MHDTLTHALFLIDPGIMTGGMFRKERILAGVPGTDSDAIPSDLIIHAAIAYTDAITIKVGGVKSQGEDHMAAVDLLRDVVALDDAGQMASSHLARMIEEKNIV